MAASSPAFSVITPLYNKAASIPRAIASVLAQTVADFEYIIVDDGSTDASVARVSEIDDPRLRLIRQDNAGAAAARNRGAAAAKAPLLAFLDADDAWEPAFLETMQALAAAWPQAGVYAAAYSVKNVDQPPRPVRFSHVPQGADGGLIESYFRVVARGLNPVWASAVCIPKSVFDAVGGFPEGVRLYEDLHLWARIAARHPMAYSPRALSVYFRDAENRRGPVALPDGGGVEDDGRLKLATVVEQAITAGQVSGEDVRHARHFVAHYTLLSAFKTLLAGYPAQARRVAAAARPDEPLPWLRKLFVLALSWLPPVAVQLIWRCGRQVKRVFRR